jgi:hypothetical protein
MGRVWWCNWWQEVDGLRFGKSRSINAITNIFTFNAFRPQKFAKCSQNYLKWRKVWLFMMGPHQKYKKQ